LARVFGNLFNLRVWVLHSFIIFPLHDFLVRSLCALCVCIFFLQIDNERNHFLISCSHSRTSVKVLCLYYSITVSADCSINYYEWVYECFEVRFMITDC
jgi:hypothetical protein